MEAKTRYIGYGRVSRVGDRAERLRSPEIQERELRQAAARADGTVVRVELDLDQSGGREDRPGLMRAIGSIEAGDAEGIVVAKLDRFSRDLRQALTLAERVHAAGGKIISYAERADWTTPDGELQVGITFAFAQYTRQVLSRSFDVSKGVAVQRGIPINPRMAPGLRLVRDEFGNRVGVEHDEEVTPAIREVFARRAAGAGPAEISDLLAERGVRTSMGSLHWSKPAVYALLRNRSYLGELRNGEHVNPAAWPPVVDAETWLAAQSPQTARRASRPRSERPALLAGLLRCWSCRYTMASTTHSRDGYRLYRCNGRHSGGTCPAIARIKAEEVEPLVLAAFWALAEGAQARRVTDERSAEVDALRVAHQRALANQAAYRDDDDLDATIEAMGGRSGWREGLMKHTERVRTTSQALADALADQSVPALPDTARLREDWDAMPVQEQREALARVIDVVGIKRKSSGLALADRVVVFAAGHGPTDLPRRGYSFRPGLRPFDDPAATTLG